MAAWIVKHSQTGVLDIDVTATNDAGKSALAVAMAGGATDVVDTLLAHPLIEEEEEGEEGEEAEQVLPSDGANGDAS